MVSASPMPPTDRSRIERRGGERRGAADRPPCAGGGRARCRRHAVDQADRRDQRSHRADRACQIGRTHRARPEGRLERSRGWLKPGAQVAVFGLRRNDGVVVASLVQERHDAMTRVAGPLERDRAGTLRIRRAQARRCRRGAGRSARAGRGPCRAGRDAGLTQPRRTTSPTSAARSGC